MVITVFISFDIDYIPLFIYFSCHSTSCKKQCKLWGQKNRHAVRFFRYNTNHVILHTNVNQSKKDFMAVKFDPPPICSIAGISCLIKLIALFRYQPVSENTDRQSRYK